MLIATHWYAQYYTVLRWTFSLLLNSTHLASAFSSLRIFDAHMHVLCPVFLFSFVAFARQDASWDAQVAARMVEIEEKKAARGTSRTKAKMAKKLAVEAPVVKELSEKETAKLKQRATDELEAERFGRELINDPSMEFSPFLILPVIILPHMCIPPHNLCVLLYLVCRSPNHYLLFSFQIEMHCASLAVPWLWCCLLADTQLWIE